MNVFELAAKLTLDKSEFESGLDGAKSSAGSFVSSIGTGFLTACKAGAVAITAMATAAVGVGKALYDGVNATAEYGDHVDKMSQKIGISTQAYQEWAYVMDLAGADVDQLQTGMKTLSSVITDAANGTDSAVEKIEALGLSVEDLNGLSQEQQLDLVISSLQGMESSAERTAIATDLLGKSATDLAPLLNMTAEETEALKQEAEDYGMVMSDSAVKASANFKDSLTKLQGTFNGVKNSIMSGFLPSMTLLVNGISDLIAGNEQAGEEIQAGIDGIVQGFTENLPRVIEVISTVANVVLQEAPIIIQSLASGLLDALPQLQETAFTIIPAIVSGLIELLPQMADVSIVMILTLADAIIDNLPQLIVTITDVIIAITEKLTEPDTLQKLIEAAIMIMFALADGIIRSIPDLIGSVNTVISNILTTLGNMLTPTLDLGKRVIIKLYDGIKAKVDWIKTGISNFVTNTITWFKNIPTNIVDVGKNIIEGLWNGINDKVEWIKGKITEFSSSVLSAIKDFFGIKSPSRVFKQIGGFMAEGLGIGWDDEYEDVKRDIESSLGGMDMSITGTRETERSNDEIELMREMIELLRAILEKDDGITDDEIFRSVRRSASTFKKSTGRLAFT